VKGLERIHLGKTDMEAARNRLETGKDPELIALGCPHLSVDEIRHLAAKLKGKKRRVTRGVVLHLPCTASKCPRELEVLSFLGQVVCDTCMIVTPIEERFKVTATNSGKSVLLPPQPVLAEGRVPFHRGLLEMIS
jgi:predicted aconitase